MLQRLAAWCYRRRRRVLALWIVALVGVSVIGTNVGSTFSQGFSLSDTESQRAAALLQSRFPAKAGDEGQIVSRDSGGVDDAGVRSNMEQLFREVTVVPGVTGVISPYTPEGARQIGAVATWHTRPWQFDRSAAKIRDATIERIRHLTDAAGVDGLRVALGGRMFQQPGGLGPAEAIGILAGS